MIDRVRAVYFDVGETLFDRTREWAAWARWVGVPAHTFSAVFGAIVASGGGVREVVEWFCPGRDHAGVHAEIAACGTLPALAEEDLYPGARAALERLRARGLFVGIAGNQPAAVGEQLRALELPADHVAVSAELGVAKPAPEFFVALAANAGVAPAEVLYVGDQPANDVLAAHAAGLPTVRVRTGPWGQLRRDPSAERLCVAVLPSVAELPELLEQRTAPLSAARAAAPRSARPRGRTPR